jgi:hypothetical protein
MKSFEIQAHLYIPFTRLLSFHVPVNRKIWNQYEGKSSTSLGAEWSEDSLLETLRRIKGD